MSGTLRTFDLWTVYNSPTDFPGKFVARKFVVGDGRFLATHIHHVADSIDEIRTLIPPGLHRLDRMPQDDAPIVEVWL